MAKEEVFQLSGTVEELLPGGKFRVLLEGGQEITAVIAGKMRRNRIRISLGDRVDVEMSPYDLTKGRIKYRHRN